jgi:hypothetical protein
VCITKRTHIHLLPGVIYGWLSKIEGALPSVDALSHPLRQKLRILTRYRRRSRNLPLTNVSMLPSRVEGDYSGCAILTGYTLYAITLDEILEDHNLQIIAETDPSQRSDTKELENTIPVRVLTDFAVYEMNTLQLVPIGELFNLQHGSPMIYGASGNVKAFSDEEGNDDEDEPDVFDQEEDDFSDDVVNQRVKLSQLMEFNVHYFKKRKLNRFIFLPFAPVAVLINLPPTVKFTFAPNMHGTS